MHTPQEAEIAQRKKGIKETTAAWLEEVQRLENINTALLEALEQTTTGLLASILSAADAREHIGQNILLDEDIIIAIRDHYTANRTIIAQAREGSE